MRVVKTAGRRHRRSEGKGMRYRESYTPSTATVPGSGILVVLLPGHLPGLTTQGSEFH